MKKLRWVVLVVAAGVAVWCAPAWAAEGSFDRTLTVNGPVMLNIKTGSGSVTVRAGAGNVVRVHGYIVSHGWLGLGGGEDKVAALVKNPPIEQTGNIIRLGRAQDDDMLDNVSISYTVETPAATTLESTTGSGAQSVSGIQGPARVHSGSGSLRISDIGGELTASTGSDGIDAEDIAGAMSLSAGSGRIHASQTKSGMVRAHSGSGGITLENVKGAVTAETGSGHITVSGTPVSQWRLHTGSGGMDLEVPVGTGFDLDARTGSGGINVDFPITMQGSLDRHHVRGRVGNGGPNLDLETGSGGIRIRQGGTI
jgi:hypothetical protein